MLTFGWVLRLSLVVIAKPVIPIVGFIVKRPVT